jgi:hypothetical protein
MSQIKKINNSLVKLKSSLWKFYGHHHDLVNRYGISVSQSSTCNKTPVLLSFKTCHRVCNKINTTCATSGRRVFETQSHRKILETNYFTVNIVITYPMIDFYWLVLRIRFAVLQLYSRKSLWYSWHISHLALNNNHPLTRTFHYGFYVNYKTKGF